MITELAFFVYPVRDMPRSRRFYESTPGLKISSNFRDEWIEYDIGAATFAIPTMDLEHQPGARGGVIAFEADDLDAEVRRLKEKAVTFVLQITETPVCRMAVVGDPDDNHVIIHKRKAA